MAGRTASLEPAERLAPLVTGFAVGVDQSPSHRGGAGRSHRYRLVRTLLDEAEAGAVRAARLGGSTWSEIGAKLGTSRQAAWEKWHELEEGHLRAG
jgi:hypothetical protein